MRSIGPLQFRESLRGAASKFEWCASVLLVFPCILLIFLVAGAVWVRHKSSLPVAFFADLNLVTRVANENKSRTIQHSSRSYITNFILKVNFQLNTKTDSNDTETTERENICFLLFGIASSKILPFFVILYFLYSFHHSFPFINGTT